MPKIIKTSLKLAEISLGYKHWPVDKDGVVQGLSPDDRRFFELQRLFKLVVLEESGKEAAQTTESLAELPKVASKTSNPKSGCK